MPELPEVETIRRQLEPWLQGRRIRFARRVDAPAGPKYDGLERAAGQRIEAVGRRGKFLICPLSGGDELVVHLGMSGALRSDRPSAHLRVELELTGPAPHRLFFEDPRRFGRFLVVGGGDYRGLPTLARMGPEPFDEAFDAAAFHRALDTPTPIKAHLLSQRPVAGLGNIYVDEALWRVSLHPSRRSRSLRRSEAAALLAAIRAVLGEAIALRGTTLRNYRRVDGGRGSFAAELAVYGRQGEPCPRCGRAIVRTVLAARGTHFCPRCQRGHAQRTGTTQRS
jgi:formamidopyrimidine-DNA glycosylase